MERDDLKYFILETFCETLDRKEMIKMIEDLLDGFTYIKTDYGEMWIIKDDRLPDGTYRVIEIHNA